MKHSFLVAFVAGWLLVSILCETATHASGNPMPLSIVEVQSAINRFLGGAF